MDKQQEMSPKEAEMLEALYKGTNTESSSFGSAGPVEITHGPMVKSGLFTDAEREAVPPEVRDAFAQAFAEVNAAMDFGDRFHKLQPYDTLRIEGVTYIKKPDGKPEQLKVYINQMERSLIELHKRYKATNEALINANVMLNKAERELLNCQNERDKLKTSARRTRVKKGFKV